jgi:hypothetical protein
MIPHKFLQIVCFTLLMIICAAPQLAAQPDNVSYFYMLTRSAPTDIFRVRRVNPTDGSSRVVFSTDPSEPIAFGEIAPPDEIEATMQLFESVDRSTENLLQAPLRTVINSIHVSPDQQQVILNARYQHFITYPRFMFYGASQLLLISDPDQAPRVLFTLGFHPTQYFPYAPEDIYIRDAQWTSDQQFLILSLVNDYYSRNQLDLPIVVLPMDGSTPFTLGTAQGWTISPTSRQIAAIKRVRLPLKDTFILIDFDAVTRQVSQSIYSLGTYITIPDYGLVYTGSTINFFLVMIWRFWKAADLPSLTQHTTPPYPCFPLN